MRERSEDAATSTRELDLLPTAAALSVIATESRRAFDAFDASASELAPIVDAVVATVSGGGRVHLFGAGTSGRLAALDAAEIPPTFGIAADVFHAHLAGGRSAMVAAVEDAEDDIEAGSVAASDVERGDVAIGLTASGRTPFVLAALAAARGRGAFTAQIDCNRPVDSPADCRVTLRTGPEVIGGSTRLNAGTAQKLALNAISTLSMMRLGRTYSNRMIALRPTNEKLRRRLVELLVELAGTTDVLAAQALADADDDGRVALAMLSRGWGVGMARDAVDRLPSMREIVDLDGHVERR